MRLRNINNAQLELIEEPDIPKSKIPSHYTNNKINYSDLSFHDWYRFVLSYPPHLVRHYIESFDLKNKSVVLDPFCGTGTTLIEAKLHGIKSYGIEANPFAHFVSSVKIDWNISPDELQSLSILIGKKVHSHLRSEGIDDKKGIDISIVKLKLRTLPSKVHDLLLENSISPLPLHKTLILLEEIHKYKNSPCYRHLLLGLAKALVFRISNLKFGPEVGVGKQKEDAPVINSWLEEIASIVSDLHSVKKQHLIVSEVFLGDSRNIRKYLKPRSIDAVITSPPYPNEKDYSRTTRLESVILGFIESKEQLREFKKNLIRSNTRNIYKGDDDSRWVEHNKDIQNIAQEIENRRIKLGKTSGFEKLYPAVTRHYFGGMARHLMELKDVLRPGAKLAYVVGDQASYLRVMIRTGSLLGDIAKSLGYELINIDLFRTRFATATGEQLREEVVVLRWKG